MRVVVVGAEGQLGADMVRWATQRGHSLVPISHADADLRDARGIARAVGAASADIVINVAAMNHVERCEAEPELALAVNALGVANLAAATVEAGIPLVHVSTDYVFDGEKGAPYVEDDLPAPVNSYGISKLAGECFVRARQPRSFIVRTSALYGIHRCRSKPQDNFVRAMLRLGREGRTVKVVNDEFVSPTWTWDLADQLLRLSETDQFGTYHASAQGSCSWLEFARAIFEEAGIEVAVEGVSASEREARVPRPRYSVLDNAALRRIGIDVMPEWRASLRRYLASIRHEMTVLSGDPLTI